VGRIETADDPSGSLSRLLPYLRPFAGRLLLVFAGIILATLFGLAGPYLMGRAIDQCIPTGRAQGLMPIVLRMLTVYLLANGFQLGASWLMAAISQQALQQLRADLFAHVQRLPLAFFDRLPAGELMSRLTSDIDAVNQAVSQNVSTLLAGTFPGRLLAAMLALDFGWPRRPVGGAGDNRFTRFVARYSRKG
jgi:ATP-binding cassette subfamily B protein